MAAMSFAKSGIFALLALALAFAADHPALPAFAWLFTATLGLRCLAGWPAWRLLDGHSHRPHEDHWKEVLLLGAYSLVTVLYFQVDSVMLYAMAGERVTGDYGNAYHFLEGSLFISAAVGSVLYPRLVTAPEREGGQLFDRFFKLLLVIAFCGTTAIWFIGPWLGFLFAGPDFAGAVEPLHLLALGLPFMFGNGFLSRWLFSRKMERFALFSASVLALFNIIGNYLLIPHYGAKGAALMTLATEGLLFFWWIFKGRRRVGLFFFFLGLLLATTLIAGLLFVWDTRVPALILTLVLAGPLLGYHLNKARFGDENTL